MMGMRRRHHATVVSLLPLILGSTLAAEAPLAEDADLYANAPQVVDLGPAAFQGDAAALLATAGLVPRFEHHEWQVKTDVLFARRNPTGPAE